jgi:hypothetical protein
MRPYGPNEMGVSCLLLCTAAFCFYLVIDGEISNQLLPELLKDAGEELINLPFDGGWVC